MCFSDTSRALFFIMCLLIFIAVSHLHIQTFILTLTLLEDKDAGNLNKKTKTEPCLSVADEYSPSFVCLVSVLTYRGRGLNLFMGHSAAWKISVCIDLGICYSISVKSNEIHIKVNLLPQK